VGKKLNKKDLLSSNLATKHGYCTQHTVRSILITNLKEIKKMKTKTAAEKKAEQLVRRHLMALVEESMDNDKTLNINAVACARVTAVTVVNTIRALFYINEKDYRFWTEVVELLATEDYSDITPLEEF